MNKVLKARNEDIAAAMRGICDAVGRLALVRDDITEVRQSRLTTVHEDALALGLERTVARLVDAAAAIPEEFWMIMLQDNYVGAEEVRQHVNATVRNAIDNAQLKVA